MVVAYAQEFAIGFFTSPNLIDWTATSNFSHHGLLGKQYECPNLVEVPINGTDETMFVLAISINPGAPLGGSITEYFIGDFNGTSFLPADGVTRISDFGKVGQLAWLEVSANMVTRTTMPGNSSTVLGHQTLMLSRSRGQAIGSTPSWRRLVMKAGAVSCLYHDSISSPTSRIQVYKCTRHHTDSTPSEARRSPVTIRSPMEHCLRTSRMCRRCLCSLRSRSQA